MVSTPRSSTESSAASGPSAAGAPPRGRSETRRNTQRLDEALGGMPGDAHTLVPPDVAALPDRERVFATPRSGDWILLAILLVTLLGCGGYVWYRLGLQDHIGRAVFFGLALVCLYWTALIYTFKLSLSVHVGPQGISVVRGPWRMELRWGDVSRLMERAQLLDGRRYRWVVAQGRDERRIQVREDMVADYARFRLEVYERYRLWRDHGGTWGTTSGGPFTARESVGDEIRWWLIGASVTALPGAYFILLLPETNPLGLALLAVAALCAAMALRAILLRQVYVVDSRTILARYLIGKAQLGWRDISRVERSRNPASWLIRAVAAMCRLAISVATRSEVGLRCFPWSPRVPEYLTLRGTGRHVRVRLHRLSRPDELLAWIEFYERVGRRPAGSHTRPRPATTTVQLGDERIAAATIPLDDLSDEGGLRDPWAAAAAIGADPIDLPTVPTPSVGASAGAADGAYDEYVYEDEDEDEQDDESAGPVVALTPEELEDAWLISTNKRPTVLAPNANSLASADPAPGPAEAAQELSGGTEQAQYAAFAQPFQPTPPNWGDAFAATAGEGNSSPEHNYADQPYANQGYGDHGAYDAANAASAASAAYEERERLRRERLERERAYLESIAGREHGDDRDRGPAGDAGSGARPERPAYSEYPDAPDYQERPNEGRQPAAAASATSGPPVWTFPDPVAPAPHTAPAEPATPASAFGAMSRNELLAELGALGPVTPPTYSGIIPPPPVAPRHAQAPQPADPGARGERRGPPAPEIADAPTTALGAIPSGGFAQSADKPAAEVEYDAEPDEREEPERPWLQEGWQPPALPRFGPGTHSPFHNPDDAD